MESSWGDIVSKKQKLNYIILHDGKDYFIAERLGKYVPFGAYNKDRNLGMGATVEECLENSQIPVWEVELKPYEVMLNV